MTGGSLERERVAERAWDSLEPSARLGPLVRHEPVMVKEVLDYLAPTAEGVYVDATVGGGGHAEAILDCASPGGILIGLDRDPGALAEAFVRLARFEDRVRLRRGSFAELAGLLLREGVSEVRGIVADLGLSSLQLGAPERGFAFSTEGPLDMRFDPDAETNAADLVNRLDERELATILFEWGEERRSRAIARRIVARRPLKTTAELRRAVVSVVGPRRRGGIDPATRTFQALRIAVNQELAALDALLGAAPSALAVGGRLVVLSYHSLEDRAVKRAFLARAREGRFRVVTRKPVTPQDRERGQNPRARSAKLRALERVA